MISLIKRCNFYYNSRSFEVYSVFLKKIWSTLLRRLHFIDSIHCLIHQFNKTIQLLVCVNFTFFQWNHTCSLNLECDAYILPFLYLYSPITTHFMVSSVHCANFLESEQCILRNINLHLFSTKLGAYLCLVYSRNKDWSSVYCSVLHTVYLLLRTMYSCLNTDE